MVKQNLNSFAIAKRLTVPEYCRFVEKVIAHLLALDEGKVTLPAGLLEQLRQEYDKLEEWSLMGRTSNETAEIAEVESKLDDLMIYLLNEFRNGRKTTITARKKAATALYNATTRYADVYKSRQNYKNSAIKSFVRDLGHDDLSEHITTLGLEAEVEDLTLKNAQFDVLLEARCYAQSHKVLEKTSDMRKSMDEALDVIATCITYASYVQPSEELNELIIAINKLLFDAEASYNQRTAQRADGENDDMENESGTENPSNETEDGEVTPEASGSSEPSEPSESPDGEGV